MQGRHALAVLAAVLAMVMAALVWRVHRTSRHARPVADPLRWRRRPVLAFGVQAVVFVVPLAGAVTPSALVSRRLPDPHGLGQTVLSWGALLATSTLALVVVDRAARRLLPLAALLRLSMLFPDHAPARMAVARRSGSVRALRRRLEHAHTHGADDEPSQAAERILGLWAELRAHDSRTGGHAHRVRGFTDLLADELRLPEDDRDRLRWAALLHDIGKLAVP